MPLSHLRASALVALGRPLDAVREVLARGLPQSAERRSYEAVRVDTCIPLLTGDFARARAALELALKNAGESSDSAI
jgi:hypothetical protein